MGQHLGSVSSQFTYAHSLPSFTGAENRTSAPILLATFLMLWLTPFMYGRTAVFLLLLSSCNKLRLQAVRARCSFLLPFLRLASSSLPLAVYVITHPVPVIWWLLKQKHNFACAPGLHHQLVTKKKVCRRFQFLAYYTTSHDRAAINVSRLEQW